MEGWDAAPKKILGLFFACTFIAQRQGNSFDKVRYKGLTGLCCLNRKPERLGQQSYHHAKLITLALKDGKKLGIPPKAVAPFADRRRIGVLEQ